MFNGEQIVMQKERLTRDNKFLLRNGVIPWIPRASAEELCENLFTQIKAYDVSREMFAFRLQVFDELLPFVLTRRKTIVDIQSGISTRLGDGQRHYDGNGQWSFSQMKGLRTHTGHLYIRGDRV